MRLTRTQGRTSYSVEDVIRSQSAQKGRGGVELGTTYTPGVVQTGLSFYWQHRPSCESANAASELLCHAVSAATKRAGRLSASA